MSIDFSKLKLGADGLVTAIVQDADTLQVLMVGYMDAAALAKTEQSGLVTFFSRSRQQLWTKGETSGNTLEFVSITPDCDRDTLLVLARPNGPTCHEGTVSCFGDDGAQGVGFLGHLARVIESRKGADPNESYTAKLLAGPLVKAAQKVGEEGVETALAAVAESDEAFKGEAADLLYHLLVVMAAKDVSVEDVIAVLQARHR
jgi:phosphoribosyl-ATP pyrophosphohydrolase/phosphoribosyl-AMP cyclohydrolase